MGGREEGTGFSINYTPRAKRQLRQLLKKSGGNLRAKFLEKASSLTQNPMSGKPLRGQLKGQFSLRFGDYRIVYSIDKIERKVIVTGVGDRKSIYEMM